MAHGHLCCRWDPEHLGTRLEALAIYFIVLYQHLELGEVSDALVAGIAGLPLRVQLLEHELLLECLLVQVIWLQLVRILAVNGVEELCVVKLLS
jgi:hypothetical protein